MKAILVSTKNGSRYLFYRQSGKDYFCILGSNTDPSSFSIEFFDMKEKSVTSDVPPSDKFIPLYDFANGEKEGSKKFKVDDDESIIVKKSIIGDIDLKKTTSLNILHSIFETVEFTSVSGKFILEEDYTPKDGPKFHPKLGKNMYISMERGEGEYMSFITTGEVSKIDTIDNICCVIPKSV